MKKRFRREKVFLALSILNFSLLEVAFFERGQDSSILIGVERQSLCRETYRHLWMALLGGSFGQLTDSSRATLTFGANGQR